MTPPSPRVTATKVENMKRQAKKLSKAEGMPHRLALDAVAKFHGFHHWHHVVNAARLTAAESTSPSGTTNMRAAQPQKEHAA